MRTPARGVLFLLLALCLMTLLLPASRADLPTQVTNGDASRAVTWTMNTTAGLIAQNVSVGGGRAVLQWINQDLAWTRASQIEANGTMAPWMTANASGLALRANWSNYVANGRFSVRAPWRYQNGTLGKVTAEWNRTLGVAELNHTSPSTQVLWDSMDAAMSGNWAASPGGAVLQNTSTPPPKQGTGTMGIEVVSPTGVSSVAAINQSLSSIDWSAYNRLILWIYLNTTVRASFNVTAHHLSSSGLLTTTAQPLNKGWQELVVDLDQLGNAAVRSSLTKVSLVFNAQPGPSIPFSTWFNLDDVRLGSAKVFNESASVSQLIRKANATTALPGSSHLSFDWSLMDASGVSKAVANVSLTTGTTISFSAALSSSALGVWHRFSQDVSSATAKPGIYNLSFGLAVAANNTTASRVEVLVDNVTLVFPEVTNGTFLSSALTMGTASDFLSLGWSGTVPAATSIRVAIRTGNNTAPGSGSWSPWDIIWAAGPHSLNVPGATDFQIQIALNTTNASVSPLLQTLSLATRHRGGIGNLTSDLFPADGDFMRWRSFTASLSVGNTTSLQFWIGNGTSWIPVVPGANLASYGGGPRLRWRAAFLSSDGLQTPVLGSVILVYEYLGPVVHVRLSPGGSVRATVGHWTYFQAAAYDAGWHRVSLPASAFVWSGGDPPGKLYSNGSYLPAQTGSWNVTVSALGFSDTVLVIVADGTPPPWPLAMPFLPYMMAIVAAAGIGFVIYEVAIRRMFAIDDVFLIAKDGRLIMHNTRRMRADRDEDILSGMLTAILIFLKDQDPEENGELKRFEVGGKTTLLDRGKHVYLASVYSGRVPPWAARDMHRFMRDLEKRFGDAFATWSGSPEDLQGLKEFMKRLVGHTRYRSGSPRGGTAS